VHSSMKAVGNVEGGAETVLDAFIEYFSDGLLLFPTHTWSSINAEHNVYDPLTEPACVGILPNLFLKRGGVIRSLHPTHSIAALGKGAKEFTAGEENSVTPCPRSGCWGRLYDWNAAIMFLGCTLKSNTLLHGVEEWNNVPDRISDEVQPLYIKIGNICHYVPMRRHQCSVPDISGRYDRMERPFIEAGIARKGTFGDAEVYLCDVRGMVDLTTEYLKKEPNFFGKD